MIFLFFEGLSLEDEDEDEEEDELELELDEGDLQLLFFLTNVIDIFFFRSDLFFGRSGELEILLLLFLLDIDIKYG